MSPLRFGSPRNPIGHDQGDNAFPKLAQNQNAVTQPAEGGTGKKCQPALSIVLDVF